jgi:hypothetical protein
MQRRKQTIWRAAARVKGYRKSENTFVSVGEDNRNGKVGGLTEVINGGDEDWHQGYCDVRNDGCYDK